MLFLNPDFLVKKNSFSLDRHEIVECSESINNRAIFGTNKFLFWILFFRKADTKLRIDSFLSRAIAFEVLRICFSFQSQG
jgi:hypothetical protein